MQKSPTLVGNELVLAQLIDSPGIAGDEDLGILKDFLKFIPGSIRRKTKIWPQGFTTVEIGPKNSKHSLLVVAHADTNGLRVTKITDDGFLRFQTVGEDSVAPCLSSIVYVWVRNSASGLPYRIPGIVGWKAMHTMENGEENKMPKSTSLAIDIGAKNRAEVEAMGIRIGDAVTFKSEVTCLENNLVAANGLDNRSGVWIVIETLCKVYKEKLNLRVVFAIVGAEEIGLVGAQKLEGLFEHFDFCIGTDVGFANDYPGDAGLRSTHADIALGKGPIIYRGSWLDRELVDYAMVLAKENNIPHQLDSISGRLGTDAMIFDLKGVRTIHFGIPCRYMHFQEVISLEDLKNTAELASELIKKINGR